MRNRIKSGILFILVVNSLILTWFLIFYSPNSSSVSLSEYLPRQKFGNDAEVSNIIKPKQIVYHFGDNTHTVVRPTMNTYRSIEEDISHWSFFDFEPIYKEIDWQTMVEENKGLEIVFHNALTYSILMSEFKVPIYNSIDLINRLWITEDQTGNIKAYFISDEKDSVFVSRTSITVEVMQEYLNHGMYLPKYSYNFAYQSEQDKNIKQIYYLPQNGIDVKTFRKSFNKVAIEDFIQLLFIDPFIVRKVHEKDNKENIIYTDGIRSMQHFPNDGYLVYFRPVSNSKKEFDIKKDINAALRFVNQHGGWDENYYLESINRLEGLNQTLFNFRKHIDGIPLYEQEDKFGTIRIQLTDSIVNTFQRSTILLDRNIEYKTIKTINDVQLVNMLEKQQIPKSDIISVELIYHVKRSQDYVELYPYWQIQIKNNSVIELPAYESVVRKFGLE